MIRYSCEKIFLVTDGHSAHKTKKLKEWLNENQAEIEVFFIPSYGPEFNAHEYLNQDVKTKLIGKERPINKPQMKSNSETFMQKKRINKTQVKKYYHGKHVKCAA